MINESANIKKEKIDEIENSENWDKMKKIGNPYELIYTTYNKKRKNDSISLYIPISRSYFKLWEIFYNFDLFKHFNINDNWNDYPYFTFDVIYPMDKLI